MDKRTLRPTKELLEIMLDNISMLKTGLCGLVGILFEKDIISISEAHELQHYIESNRPKTRHDIYYYWKIGNSKPRINWLMKHIEKNS